MLKVERVYWTVSDDANPECKVEMNVQRTAYGVSITAFHDGRFVCIGELELHDGKLSLVGWTWPDGDPDVMTTLVEL